MRNPFQCYIHHLMAKYEGEAVLTEDTWVWSDSPVPENGVGLWQPQFAKNSEDRNAMKMMGAGMPAEKGEGRGQRRQSVGGVGCPLLDYRQCPTTTMLQWEGDGKDGHWHRKGTAMSLTELFFKFGKEHSAYEIFFWYLHAEKLCLKRDHSWGSATVRQAAHARYEATGRWGHKGERRGRWG